MPTAQTILDRKGVEVQTIKKEATVLEAARLMNDKRIGALIVLGGEKVLGIFTERDLLMRVVAKKLDPDTTPVQDVMTTPMACCTRETKLSACKAVMTAKKIRHLPVVEDHTSAPRFTGNRPTSALRFTYPRDNAAAFHRESHRTGCYGPYRKMRTGTPPRGPLRDSRGADPRSLAISLPGRGRFSPMFLCHFYVRVLLREGLAKLRADSRRRRFP